jgi:hypothetical protein
MRTFLVATIAVAFCGCSGSHQLAVIEPNAATVLKACIQELEPLLKGSSVIEITSPEGKVGYIDDMVFRLENNLPLPKAKFQADGHLDFADMKALVASAKNPINVPMSGSYSLVKGSWFIKLRQGMPDHYIFSSPAKASDGNWIVVFEMARWTQGSTKMNLWLMEFEEDEGGELRFIEQTWLVGSANPMPEK